MNGMDTKSRIFGRMQDQGKQVEDAAFYALTVVDSLSLDASHDPHDY